ncbi:MAG: hypothetical protein ACP5U1_05165 [Desulfomonilaceae bacterium]
MYRKVWLGMIVFLGLFSLASFWSLSFANAEEPRNKDSILLTIFLKHDQSKTLEEINKHLDQTGFWKQFPPKGVEVVSWYVMMGIGQVVTLRVPPDRLRAVNLVIEKCGWGSYRTEFYPTYDFKSVWEHDFKKK